MTADPSRAPTPPRGVSIVPESDQPLVDARQDGAIAHLRHRQLWTVVLSIVAAVLAAVDLVVAVTRASTHPPPALTCPACPVCPAAPSCPPVRCPDAPDCTCTPTEHRR